jgi:hypothetical protein
MKTEYNWCISNGSTLLSWTMRSRRRDCIAEFIQETAYANWKEVRRCASFIRVVKVKCQYEVEK